MLSIIRLRLLRLKDDFMVLLLMTVMAIGLTAVFGVSFNTYRPTIMLVDEDKSVYSENFIQDIKDNKSFKFIDSDLNDAVKEVEDGNALAGLLIKDGFKDDIEKGEDINLEFIKIKDDTLILTLQKEASSIALKMAGGIKVADIAADFIRSDVPDANLEDVKTSAYENVMDSWKYKTPIEVKTTITNSLKDSGYDGMKHTMIGFTIFFSMYTMVFAIGTILSDKQYKTWQRMLISPVSKFSILGGSMVVAYLTGILQMGVLILGGGFLLGVDWGNSMGGVLLISSAFVFAVTSLGLLMSGIVKTQAQLGSMAPIVLTSTSMIGGTMWPLEIVNNKVLLFLAEITPQKWAMQGIDSIASKGMGFEAAITPTMVLLLMGVIFFTFGVKIMKFE